MTRAEYEYLKRPLPVELVKLRKFDYYGKEEEVIGLPDEKLIGPPSALSEHNPSVAFPNL